MEWYALKLDACMKSKSRFSLTQNIEIHLQVYINNEEILHSGKKRKEA